MKLQNKFQTLLVPAWLLAGVLVLSLVQRAVHKVIIGGIELSAAALANAAARDAAAGMASRIEMELLPALQDLQLRIGALYAAAIDPRGKVIAHTAISEKGKIEDDPFFRAAIQATEPMTRKAVLREEPVLLLAVPVWSTPASAVGEEFLLSGQPQAGQRTRLGTLKLAVPLRLAQETEAQIIREVSLIVIVIGGIVFGLIIALVRGMLAPIRGLLSGIARVRGGRFDVKVPVLSSDELGDLAESFNIMSGELERTTVSKEYVEGILENMSDLLVVTDREGRIQTVNHAAAVVLGNGEIVGKPLASFFESAPQTETVRDIEIVLRTRHGGRMEALLSSSVLRDREGRPRGYISAAKDITERKRVEEAMLAAKLAAEAASRELEAFSYSVAHDLRAPLRSIDGFSQLLLEDYADKLDESGKDYLKRVRGGSKKMSQLIDDLLNLSRITRSVLRIEDVSLSALAAEAAGDLSKGEPDRRVEFKIAPNLSAKGDLNFLRIVLVNLLANSWKYTSRHPKARIEFGALKQGDHAVYFVRDDGAGFDMSFSNRLFKPFTRLHTESEFEGNGIGLATVQRVISRHEGRIWGEGAVEQGAVFYFTLWEMRS